MNSGRYVYCIVETTEPNRLGEVGLLGNPVTLVCHKDIGAAVSPIEYKELEPNIDTIISHQRVVESSRKLGTTLPVKFGVIFKNEQGVRTLLQRSYDDYRKKLTKLSGMDEYGVKVLFNKSGLAKIRSGVEKGSPEIRKLRDSLENSGEGRSYFTKLKMSEAVKNEAYKKLDELSRQVHEELSLAAKDSSILKSDHEQIILNAAYLVRREKGQEFLSLASRLGREYSTAGLIIHSSGPWAPYSFC